MARRSRTRSRSRGSSTPRQMIAQAVVACLLAIVLLVVTSMVSSPVLKPLAQVIRVLAWVMFIGGALAAVLLYLKRSASATEPLKTSSHHRREPFTPAPTPRRDSTQAREPRTTDVGFAAVTPIPTVATALTPERPTAWSPLVFDVIEWRRFEALCERLFAQAGFETRSQSHGADEGIDIWLHSKHQPEVAASLVQCKCWGTRSVAVEQVRALLGSMAAKKVTRGVFATTSQFTAEASRFARENGIHLLDRAGLIDLIRKRSPDQQRDLLMVATEGEFWVPTCASCGVKMVRRHPRSGGKGFWGCANFPRCRNRLNG